MIARLAEEKLRWGGPPSAPAVSPPAEPPPNAEPSRQASDSATIGAVATGASAVLTPRQALETAIADDPAELGNYLALARLLAEQGAFEQGLLWLDRAERNCAQRSAVQQARERLQAERAEAAAQAARHRRGAKPSRGPRRSYWLEFLLGTAVAALVLQLIPGAQAWAVEFGQRHLRGILIAVNVLVLLALVWWNQRVGRAGSEAGNDSQKGER
jgi:hypothetical protein